MNHCKQCSTPVKPRAKYCSDKCRMAFTRTKEPVETSLEAQTGVNPNTNPNKSDAKANKPEQNTPEPEQNLFENEQNLFALTLPEQSGEVLDSVDVEVLEYHEQRGRKDWVNFTEQRTQKCIECKKKFSTHLSLFHYCSIDCSPLYV